MAKGDGKRICECECGGTVRGFEDFGRLWTWCDRCSPVTVTNPADIYDRLPPVSQHRTWAVTAPHGDRLRGAGWDIVDEAILAYDEWMADDDYNATAKLHEIISRMKERRALYHGGGHGQ